MRDIGRAIETNGWRQGSLLCEEDGQALAAELGCEDVATAVAVVVSQSCDLTQADIAAEPYAEVIVGHWSHTRSGDLLYGKHPRRLHLPVQGHEGEETISLLPWQRLRCPRERLAEWEPDPERYLLRADLQVLTTWLAQRYVRGALPNTFNDLLTRKRKTWEKLRKRLSGHVSGLFVELSPSGELGEGDHYSVNLLALVPVAQKETLEEAQETVRRLGDLMQELGMDVQASARCEDEVSYAVVRRMTRFPLEYLSLRGDPTHPMPEEFESRPPSNPPGSGP